MPRPTLSDPPALAALGLLLTLAGLSAAGVLRRLAPGMMELSWGPPALACAALLPPFYYLWAMARSKPAPLLRSRWAPWFLAAFTHLAVQLGGGTASDLFGSYALLMLALGAYAPLTASLPLAAVLSGLEAASGPFWGLLLPWAGFAFGRALAASSAPPPEVPAAAPAQPAFSSELPGFDPAAFFDKSSARLIDLAFSAHPSWNSLLLFWKEEGSWRCVQARSRGAAPKEGVTLVEGEGMLGLSLKDRKRLALGELAPTAAQALPYLAEGAAPPRALLAQPLQDEDRPAGLIAVDRAEAGVWSPDEIHAVDALGQQVVSQFQQAGFMAKVRAKGQQLERLHHVSRDLAADMDRGRLLARVEELCARLLPFDAYYLALRDGEQPGFYLAASRGYLPAFAGEFKLDETTVLGGSVLQSREPLIYNAERAEASIPPFLTQGLESPMASYLLVPLVLSGRVTGLLKLDRSGLEGFSEPDREVARTFADQAAVVLEHARLYTEHQLRATTDGLTGLFNHRYFQERLAVELARAARTGKPLSLALTDIDFFKKFNDSFGHQEGDNVLRKAAKLLKESVRQDQDIVCRYGGEEFVVILPECDLVEAREVLDRLRQRCADTLVGGTGPEARAITLSVGLSSFPLAAKEQRDLIHLADEALYKAKQTGRNRVCSFKDLP